MKPRDLDAIAPTEHPGLPVRPDAERGSAFVLVLILLIMMGGVIAILFLATSFQSKRAFESDLHQKRLLTADNGLAKALVLIKDTVSWTNTYRGWTGTDATGTKPTEDPGDGTGAQTLVFADGATVTGRNMTPTGTSQWTYQLRSLGKSSDGTDREIELILRVTQVPPTPQSGPGLGAVIGNGDFKINGTITIDGNDHYPDGTVGGDGNDAMGITTTGTLIDQGGSAIIGGNGESPTKTPTAGTSMETNSTVWTTMPNGSDDDGDGLIDEDDDGDGVIDEVNGFPDHVGGFFGKPDNSDLINRAKFDNLYFVYQGVDGTGNPVFSTPDGSRTYADWVASTQQVEKGGKIIYLEVPPSAFGDQNGDGVFDATDDALLTDLTIGNLELPENPDGAGAKPSMVIVAESDPFKHRVKVGPVHVENNGDFQGFFSADTIRNTNGSGLIVGSILAFNGFEVDTTIFGNGTIDIVFSSEVISKLPGTDLTTAQVNVSTRLWREVQ